MLPDVVVAVEVPHPLIEELLCDGEGAGEMELLVVGLPAGGHSKTTQRAVCGLIRRKTL